MRSILFIIVFAGAFLILFFLGLKMGSFDVDFSVIKEAILNYDPLNNIHYIIINLRLPRILLAFFVGGSLAFSGYVMQVMVNNPLADPYILGTASGASLGASVSYLLLPVSVGILIPSFSAFAGAMIVTVIAILIAYEKGHLVPSKLLLVGIALSSLTISLISLMIFFSGDEAKLKTIVFWSMGSFSLAKWDYIPLLAVSLLIIVTIFSFFNKHLNLLLLGESRSQNIGLNVTPIRWIILIASSLVTGFSVATCGPIGFVGLMIPHFIRGINGINGKHNILYSTLFGGVFMLVCDLLSRVLYSASGIPIGIITSFLGIPFFVYLLSKKNYKFS